ncbi:16S rRNA processing protein RimM [Actinobaculum sp. oral taxon 183 str. F0552]|jgi:16S rRNA processing protein rimM|nr:16S rRNA processing protein RimM [Actinobaculum sp. oral taxon 183 str. F0552]
MGRSVVAGRPIFIGSISFVVDSASAPFAPSHDRLGDCGIGRAGPSEEGKRDAMQLTVAVIGSPRGLKGEVRLDVRTDQPERRLAPGTMLETDPAEVGPLTLVRARQYKGGTYAVFAECSDRTMAERLRGIRLTVETDEDEYVEDDAWYEHELVGLEALDPEGRTLGRVGGLETGAAQDLLLVREQDGGLVRVPLVREIVTEVDLEGGRVVIDAPGGLFSEAPHAADGPDPADAQAAGPDGADSDSTGDPRAVRGEGAGRG